MLRNFIRALVVLVAVYGIAGGVSAQTGDWPAKVIYDHRAVPARRFHGSNGAADRK